MFSPNLKSPQKHQFPHLLPKQNMLRFMASRDKSRRDLSLLCTPNMHTNFPVSYVQSPVASSSSLTLSGLGFFRGGGAGGKSYPSFKFSILTVPMAIKWSNLLYTPAWKKNYLMATLMLTGTSSFYRLSSFTPAAATQNTQPLNSSPLKNYALCRNSFYQLGTSSMNSNGTGG